MPQAITRFTVLMSSPSDTESECKAAESEIQAINRTHGGSTGIEFFPIDWRRDSRADSGDEPQALLNRQLVDGADIVLAILKERMGTPTKSYLSGTEEEIMLALDAGKKVLIYFWEPPADFRPKDGAQFDALRALKGRVERRTMYATFTDVTSLCDKVRHDFTKLLFELEESGSFAKPGLSLTSITAEGSIDVSEALAIPRIGSSRLNPEALDGLVSRCYGEAVRCQLKPMGSEASVVAAGVSGPTIPASPSSLKLSKSVFGPALDSIPVASIFPQALEPVEIPECDRAIVEKTLLSLDIAPHEDLFCLDHLKRSTLQDYMPYRSGEDNLVGSDESKEKYKLLNRLIRFCKCRHDYQTFLSSLDVFTGVHFALTNEGGGPAHHVLVELSIPLGVLVCPDGFPIPSPYFVANGLVTYEGVDAFVEHLYKLGESSSYRLYSDSRVLSESGIDAGPLRIPLTSSPYGKDAVNESDYRNTVEHLFDDYTFIVDNANKAIVVRLSFDVAQHCASYAFPTYLFVEDTEDVVVHYRITADEISKPVEGDLKISIE